MAIPEIFKKKSERPLKPEAVDPDFWEKTIGRRRIFAEAANIRRTSHSRLTR